MKAVCVVVLILACLCGCSNGATPAVSATATVKATASPVQSYIPTETPSPTATAGAKLSDFIKGKEDIYGMWSTEAGYPAGVPARYIFRDDGTFTYYPSDEDTRPNELLRGTWKKVNDTLVLSVTQKVFRYNYIMDSSGEYAIKHDEAATTLSPAWKHIINMTSYQSFELGHCMHTDRNASVEFNGVRYYHFGYKTCANGDEIEDGDYDREK